MITITGADIDALQEETGLTFDEARREALKNYIDVQACPGSGKTTLVGAKLTLLAKKWRYNHQGLCVLSHTNVAKNEIVERLEQHPQGRSLLGYPHFIGTIQEFVNKFLGIPYCRSHGFSVNHIDDELCHAIISRHLGYGTKKYLANKYASVEELQYRFENNELILKVPAFPKLSKSNSYNELCQAKEILLKSGYYFFREMYEFGQACINQNPSIVKALRHRFPVVFIDEMQDTSLFQDEIISGIFDDPSCRLQRFGDPDQAIFEGSDSPNISYNDATHEVICSSHRFSPSIAQLASGLSHKGLTIESLQNRDELPHTIFLVDEQTRQAAIPAFAELCSVHLPPESRRSIKAVGAIGKESSNGLTIPHYFPDFDKSKASRNFKPRKFIHYFSLVGDSGDIHASQNYRSVLEGISRYARLLGKQKLSMPDGSERYYTADGIKQYLKATDNLRDFNAQYLSILEKGLQDENQWQKDCNSLLALAGLQVAPGNVQTYIGYEKPEPLSLETNTSRKNIFSYTAGDQHIDIEVATIHSVKGETHSGTLVLETKFKQSYDIKNLLDYLLGIKSQRITTPQNKRFMKQLYVAMTRPQYLLCLAVDKSRISDEQVERARSLGWQISDLT